MRRNSRAFLFDIVEAADAILEAVTGLTLEQYRGSRLIRSSFEREFIIIGEALSSLSRLNNELFSQIQHAAQITSFRNKLTHEYISIHHGLVWRVIPKYLQPLRDCCNQLLQHLNRELG